MVSSSLAAGGRYDKIISKFLNSNKEYPAVGISFGLEPIYITLKNTQAQAFLDNRVFVIPIKKLKEAIAITRQLRKANIKAEINLREKGGITKSLNYANAKKFTWVVIIGPKEVEQQKFTLRNMVSGEEQQLPVNDIILKIKNYSAHNEITEEN